MILITAYNRVPFHSTHFRDKSPTPSVSSAHHFVHLLAHSRSTAHCTGDTAQCHSETSDSAGQHQWQRRVWHWRGRGQWHLCRAEWRSLLCGEQESQTPEDDRQTHVQERWEWWEWWSVNYTINFSTVYNGSLDIETHTVVMNLVSLCVYRPIRVGCPCPWVLATGNWICIKSWISVGWSAMPHRNDVIKIYTIIKVFWLQLPVAGRDN